MIDNSSYVKWEWCGFCADYYRSDRLHSCGPAEPAWVSVLLIDIDAYWAAVKKGDPRGRTAEPAGA
jgi:hypothetical protein